MKKKILVLGTGDAQTDFIKHCRLVGFEVHTCSYKPEGRGIYLSDHFSIIDIKNSEQVLEYAKANGIDIIYSVGSDIAMSTVSVVSDLLNLPVFVSVRTANICNNKTLLRETLRRIPHYSLGFMQINEETDLSKWGKYPAIIKPNDSQGQRGISKVFSSEQLIDAYQKAIFHSHSGTAIVEEYVQGFEISVNLYIIQGVIVLQFITERISFEEFPGGIIKSHIYPVRQKINIDKVTEMCCNAVKLLKINNGPVYFQIKIDSKDQPKIIEITPRLDGCHIWRLIKEVRGINLFEVILKHLTSEKILIDKEFSHTIKDKISKAELSFFTSPPNTPFNIKRYSSSKEAIYTEWYYKNNDIVRPINQYAEKVGYQILKYK